MDPNFSASCTHGRQKKKKRKINKEISKGPGQDFLCARWENSKDSSRAPDPRSAQINDYSGPFFLFGPTKKKREKKSRYNAIKVGLMPGGLKLITQKISNLP